MSDHAEKALPCTRIVRGQQALTPDQLAYARHSAQEHFASMFSTAEVEEAEAEALLRQVYRAVDLKPPRHIRWFDSPRAFVLANSVPGRWKRVENTIRDIIYTLLLGNRGGNISPDEANAMWPPLYRRIQENISHIVWYLLSQNELYFQHNVYDRLRDCTCAYDIEPSLVSCCFLHEVFEPNKLIYLARFNELVSGYRLRKKEAWLVRKPIRLHWDEEGRLHSAESIALEYRDGWGCYAWHGVPVPEKLVLHPEQLTVEEWLKEVDLEVQRLMQERLGSERFVQMVEGICIDRSERGELIEIELGEDPEEVAHYVRVKDSSTPRQYYLRVPPSIRRADEAIAWTFGLVAQDYRPEQET